MSKYNADTFQVLEGLEAVRRKPGMYLGAADSYGMFIAVKEVVDNACDEAMNGHATVIKVDHKGGIWTISDNGRGVPVDIHTKTKTSALILAFGRLHAGAKIEGKTAYGKGSSGTFGVGAAVCNAVSHEFTAWSFRKKWHNVNFKRGELISDLNTKISPPPDIAAKKAGTVVRFSHDASIFNDAKFPMDTFRHYLENRVAWLKGVSIEFNDGKKTRTYKGRGVKRWLKRQLKNHETVCDPFIYQDSQVQIALAWTKSSNTAFNSMVCGSPTPNGGTHMRGLETTLNECLKSLLKKQDVSIGNLLTGAVGFINVNVISPSFHGQTKTTLQTPEARTKVIELLTKPLTKWVKANKSKVQDIVDQAVRLQQVDAHADTLRKAARNLKLEVKGKSMLPSNLMEAPDCKPHERELYIVEGDSAAGGGRLVKSKYNQEILKLRGKIMNPFRQKTSDVLASEMVLSILQSIGYKPKVADPLSHLRVGKIILCTDRDVDGGHISVLIMSLFQRFLPDLFNRGLVYDIQAPLYIYKGKDKPIGADSLNELKKKVGGKFNSAMVTRLKGWGEAQKDELKEWVFGPNRKLIRILPLEKGQIKEFSDLVGENSDYRKVMLGLTKKG